MEPLRDKRKRIAHVAKIGLDDRIKLIKLAKRIKSCEQNRAPTPKVIATGTVTPGKILSKRRFKDLIDHVDDLILSGSSEASSNEFRNIPEGMRLRERNGDFTYNEYFLIDRYYTQAYYWLKEGESMRRKEFKKEVNDDGKKLKKIFMSRTWNESPTSYFTPKRWSGRALHWDEFLKQTHLGNIGKVAPVELFKQAPLSHCWKEIAKPGLNVEFLNPYIDIQDGTAYWFGSILCFAGYLALVRLDLLNDDDRHDYVYLAWVSFCSDRVKPLGWCDRNGMKLSLGEIRPPEIPSKKMSTKRRKFYSFFPPTIHRDHLTRILKNLNKIPFNPAIPVEVVDIDNPHETRLGKISAQIDQFVHVALYDDNTDGQGLWLNVNSNLIHPFGWSNAVGVQLNGIPVSVTKDYALDSDFFFQDDCTYIDVEEGMRLEIRHPVLIFKIVEAVVVKVLKFGNFIVRTMEKCKGTRIQFVVHLRNCYIFPWGWAARNKIRVDKCPNGVERPDLRLDFLPKRVMHNFKVGMKLEALDPLNARFVMGATIQKIAGHLLYLHFDNTDFIPVNTVWMDAEHGEIFPAGYAELVGFKFQGFVYI